jgi:hypothetical protein
MNEREQVRWELAGPKERLAVVILCGWCRRAARAFGLATATGKRIANTAQWDNLSPAARRVLTQHGIVR